MKERCIYVLTDLSYSKQKALMKKYLRRRWMQATRDWCCSGYVSTEQLMNKFKLTGVTREEKENLLIKLHNELYLEMIELPEKRRRQRDNIRRLVKKLEMYFITKKKEKSND